VKSIAPADNEWEPNYGKLSGKYPVLIAVSAFIVSLLLDEPLGHGRGLAVGISIIILASAALMYWQFKNKTWFWLSLSVLAVVHGFIIFAFSWDKLAKYSGLMMLAPGMVDLLVSLFLIRMFGRIISKLFAPTSS
jgi:hypothetical protein